MLFCAECVEAGLPYDWSRLNIDPKYEKEIVRALFNATREANALHATPSQGHGVSSATGNRAVIDVQTKSVGEMDAPGQEAQVAISRWDFVRLKEVKELTPDVVEYWQIKMVLARLKTGWSGYSSWCP